MITRPGDGVAILRGGGGAPGGRNNQFFYL